MAVDAARAGLPVAVAGYGLALDRYSPLPVLQSERDWRAFLAGPEREPSRDFLRRNVLPEDGLRRIIDVVSGQAGG